MADDLDLTIVTLRFDAADPERLQAVLAKYVVLTRWPPGVPERRSLRLGDHARSLPRDPEVGLARRPAGPLRLARHGRDGRGLPRPAAGGARDRPPGGHQRPRPAVRRPTPRRRARGGHAGHRVGRHGRASATLIGQPAGEEREGELGQHEVADDGGRRARPARTRRSMRSCVRSQPGHAEAGRNDDGGRRRPMAQRRSHRAGRREQSPGRSQGHRRVRGAGGRGRWRRPGAPSTHARRQHVAVAAATPSSASGRWRNRRTARRGSTGRWRRGRSPTPRIAQHKQGVPRRLAAPTMVG